MGVHRHVQGRGSQWHEGASAGPGSIARRRSPGQVRRGGRVEGRPPLSLLEEHGRHPGRVERSQRGVRVGHRGVRHHDASGPLAHAPHVGVRGVRAEPDRREDEGGDRGSSSSWCAHRPTSCSLLDDDELHRLRTKGLSVRQQIASARMGCGVEHHPASSWGCSPMKTPKLTKKIVRDEVALGDAIIAVLTRATGSRKLTKGLLRRRQRHPSEPSMPRRGSCICTSKRS